MVLVAGGRFNRAFIGPATCPSAGSEARRTRRAARISFFIASARTPICVQQPVNQGESVDFQRLVRLLGATWDNGYEYRQQSRNCDFERYIWAVNSLRYQDQLP